jgi:predicted glycoside hydrolase/deacetylase ChbG (UPF0249 family)
MKTNPVLNKLGFSKDDRLVIIHTDDIGMCHASIQAFIELHEFGSISSGATMVPCSWFPYVASQCRRIPNADMGVHLTLTSEWDTYRWAPISTCDRASGLIDPDGYFYRSSDDTQHFGNKEAVKIELQEQINRALNAGINITHLDTHMNTVAHPKFISDYIWLAVQYKIPFLFPRLDETGFQQLGMTQELASMAASYVNYIEEQGIPMIDYVSGLYLDQPQNRLEQAKKVLSVLPAGISHFIIHPSKDTPELRAITPDWQCRVADYNTFLEEDLRKYINDIGLHVIGYQSLKNLI